MPALRWLSRRWNTGSDDFVFIGTLFAVAHLAIAIIAFLGAYADHLSRACPSAPPDLKTFVITLLATHCTGFICFSIILFSSSRGRILEPSRRWIVSPLLYVAALVGLMNLTLGIWGAVLANYASFSSCESTTFHGLRTAVASQWVFFALWVVTLIIRIDLFGHVPDEHFDDEQLYQSQWQKRFRGICCCWRTEHNEAVFEDIAQTFAALFRGHDLVTSDIAAALVLLYGHQRHVLLRRRDVMSLPSSSSPRLPPSYQISGNSRPFHPWSAEDREVLRRIKHFSNFMLGSYGALNYVFMNIVSGVPRLCCADPSMCCRSRPGVHAPACCHCDNTALNLIAGLADDDVLMTDFDSDVLKPVFYVAVDRATRSIVIAIRGTMSIQDLMTDGAATPTSFPLRELPSGEPAYAHRGFAIASQNVLEKLSAVGIIDDVLLSETYRDHQIVVVGHSLGSGVAVLLTLLLRDKYETLKNRLTCLAYAPPGGLLSRNIAEFTRPFITGMFFGKDLVPRLSFHSMAEFRDSMFHALAATQLSKAGVVSTFCCRSFEDVLPPSPELTPEVRTTLTALLTPPHVVSAVIQDVPLFPPATMIHFVKAATRNQGCCGTGCCALSSSPTTCVTCCGEEDYCPVWVSIDDLRHVICSPNMVRDHLPDRFHYVLNHNIDKLERGELEMYVTAGVGKEVVCGMDRDLLYRPVPPMVVPRSAEGATAETPMFAYGGARS